MKDFLNNNALFRHMIIASEFQRWLQEEGEKLISSAELLGGPNWAESAAIVVEAAQAGEDLASERHRIFLLHRLLHLDFVNDLDSDESARFFEIHPDDPRADEARICAEALDQGLRSLQALREALPENARNVA